MGGGGARWPHRGITRVWFLTSPVWREPAVGARRRLDLASMPGIKRRATGMTSAKRIIPFEKARTQMQAMKRPARYVGFWKTGRQFHSFSRGVKNQET